MKRLPLVLLCATLGLMVSCGKGGSAPSPAAPELPGSPQTPVLPGSDTSDPSVRSSANVTEGEVVVSGTGAEVLELPVSAKGFAILQLTAEPADGGTNPGLLATARIAQPIGGFSVAPVGAYSSYGIPQSREPRTFSRHFAEDGLMRVELTNEPPGETAGDGPVRWRYRMSETPDPLEVPTVTHFGEFESTPLELGVVHQDTLVRGVRERGWTMRRTFSVDLEQDKAYRFEVHPLVSDPAWTWRITTNKVGLASQALMRLDGAWDEATTIDWKAWNDGAALFDIWVDAPNDVSGLQAATFEVTVREIPLAPPEVTAVLPEKIWTQYQVPRRFSKWLYATDGTLKGTEGSPASVRVYGSGCPCTITVDPEQRPTRNSSQNGDTKRVYFRLAEAGEQELRLTLHNAAGSSVPHVFRYRSEPGLPLVYLDGEFEFGQNRIEVPAMQPVTIPMVARFRAQDLQIDYGPNATPRYATDPLQPVMFLSTGGESVYVTATNEVGSYTSKLDIAVPGPRVADSTILQVPILAGVPTRLSAINPNADDVPSWHFWGDGYPSTATGSSAFVTFAQPGWHQASLTVERDGEIDAQGFSFLVNPPATSVLAAHAMPGLYGSEYLLAPVKYQDGVLGAIHYQSNGTVELRHWKADGTSSMPFPRIFRPSNADDGRPGIDLVVWQGIPHLAIAYDDVAVQLWRLSAAGNEAMALSPAFTDAQSPLDYKTDLVSLAVRADTLILSAAQHASSDRRRLLVGAIPWEGGVADESTLSVPVDLRLGYIRTLPADEGLLTLLGGFEVAQLIRTPMTSPQGFGQGELSDRTQVAQGGHSGRYSFLKTEDRFYWITGTQGPDDSIAPYALTSTTWAGSLQSQNWQHQTLPSTGEQNDMTAHQLVQIQGHVHILADFKGLSRVLDLSVDPTTGSWLTTDRIDTLGPSHLMRTMPVDDNLILLEGQRSETEGEQLLYVTAY